MKLHPIERGGPQRTTGPKLFQVSQGLGYVSSRIRLTGRTVCPSYEERNDLCRVRLREPVFDPQIGLVGCGLRMTVAKAAPQLVRIVDVVGRERGDEVDWQLVSLSVGSSLLGCLYRYGDLHDQRAGLMCPRDSSAHLEKSHGYITKLEGEHVAKTRIVGILVNIDCKAVRNTAFGPTVEHDREPQRRLNEDSRLSRLRQRGHAL